MYISNAMDMLQSVYLILVLFYLVLFWCENWNLSLREEHRLRVYEKRVLREIFGTNGRK